MWEIVINLIFSCETALLVVEGFLVEDRAITLLVVELVGSVFGLAGTHSFFFENNYKIKADKFGIYFLRDFGRSSMDFSGEILCGSWSK